MPIALDPARTFDLYLSGDETVPLDERPALVFRYPTARQYRQLSDSLRNIDLAKTDVEAIDMMCGAIRCVLVGWRNMVDECGKPIAYDPMDLDRVVSVSDLQELCVRVREAAMASEIDLKKSALPSKSETGGSAGDVAEPSAKTPPAHTSP